MSPPAVRSLPYAHCCTLTCRTLTCRKFACQECVESTELADFRHMIRQAVHDKTPAGRAKEFDT
jgi:hypothetical protein